MGLASSSFGESGSERSGVDLGPIVCLTWTGGNESICVFDETTGAPNVLAFWLETGLMGPSRLDIEADLSGGGDCASCRGGILGDVSSRGGKGGGSTTISFIGEGRPGAGPNDESGSRESAPVVISVSAMYVLFPLSGLSCSDQQNSHTFTPSETETHKSVKNVG